jgi:hypothetical protein
VLWKILWHGQKGIPQGLKPFCICTDGRPKAEALGYLDAIATTEADPPFDFAQGRLFGDDRKKSDGKGKSNRNSNRNRNNNSNSNSNDQ